MRHWSPAELERVQADTPLADGLVHLNNAGASPSPTPVLETMIDHLLLEASLGGYEAAAAAAPDLEQARSALADMLGVRTDELAMTDSASRAWMMAAYAVPLQDQDRVLVSRAEYATNGIALAHLATRTGASIEIIPDDEHGQTCPASLADMLDERVQLVAVTHVPSQGGLVNPAAAIGAVTRDAGVLYLLDACQSVGQFPVDVAAIGADLVSITGRKFLRAPRGTGALVVREDAIERLEPAMFGNGGARWTGPGEFEAAAGARRFELFESSVAAQLGLGAAARYALDLGLDRIGQRVFALGDMLRNALAGRPRVSVCDRGVNRCGIVTFTVDGVTPDRVKAELAAQSINVEVARAEHGLFDLGDRGIENLVRASIHYFTDDGDLDRLLLALDDIAAQ